MQNLPGNFEDLSSKEKIKLIVPLNNPIKNGSLVLIGEHKRTYLMEIMPQKGGTFEGDNNQKIIVKCIAQNMDEAFNGICALLTDTFEVCENESRKKRECGRWYEGNKYFLNLLKSATFKKSDLENKNTIDARPTIKRINQIIKEEREKSREENKRRKEERKKFELNNPAKVIRFIPNNTKNSTVSDAIDELKVEFKEIPQEASIKKVVANYNENSFYELDLINQTCGCEKFQQCSIYPVNDIRRLCPHLRGELFSKHVRNIPELAECYISYGSRRNSEITKYQLSSGVPFYIGHSGLKCEWIDVYARKREKGEKEGNFTGFYERYGYNLLEKRWSYGEGPAGASEIKKQIAILFPSVSSKLEIKIYTEPFEHEVLEILSSLPGCEFHEASRPYWTIPYRDDYETYLKQKFTDVADLTFEYYKRHTKVIVSVPGACYIATVVYGSYDAPEVLVLRKFRDIVLKRYSLGKMFISFYYLVSPFIAQKLQYKKRINSAIRWGLDKIVKVIG